MHAPLRPPLLVIGWGNPSRGDDALGPLFVERAEQMCAAQIAAGRIEFLSDFQLQVEHVLDLVGRARVLFVDASVSAAEPFELRRAAASADASFTTHALSPEAVMHAYRITQHDDPPSAEVLGIRGYRFELGESLSSTASANLDAALGRFLDWLREH